MGNKKNKAQDELCNYLDWKIPSDNPQILLPLFHNCDVDSLKAYLRNEIIDTEECEVFPSEKCYAFYGASRFKKPGEDEISGLPRAIEGKAPSCLILRADSIDNALYRIYPFDTGSACNPNYTKRAVPYKPEDIKERLHLGTSLLRVNKVIFHFFKNLEDYIDGKLAINSDGKIAAHFSIPPNISSLTEIETLHTSQSSGDKREICTEFIFDQPVPLNPEVLEGFVAAIVMVPEIEDDLREMSKKYQLNGLETKFFPSKNVLSLQCYNKIEDFSIDYSKRKLSS